MKSFIKRIKTLSKTAIAIYLFLAVVILGSVMVYATVTTLTNSYRISASSTNNQITGYNNDCFVVANNRSNDIFVPKKTLIERTRFSSTYTPSQVTLVAGEAGLCGAQIGRCLGGTTANLATIGDCSYRDCIGDCNMGNDSCMNGVNCMY